MPAPAAPILVLNSGSSSLKLGVFTAAENDEQPLLSGAADALNRPDGSLSLTSPDGSTLLNTQHTAETSEQALEALTTALHDHLPAPPVAIGHRVVHGGPHLREHQRITPQLLQTLEDSIHFAPLHIPEALAIIRKAQQLFPEVPQFACFDTAFHRSMPPVATHLPIPSNLFDQGVQRYGFHGLSCESVMHRLGSQPPARVIIAHLGGGSSVTAVHDGQSVDTTMSLSPSGGVPMATRSGDLDPGVLLYLLRSEHLSPDTLESFVNHQCGLAGLTNGESDMRALLDKATNNDKAAELAVDLYTTALRKQIGAFIALLGGLDLLVFTGGIGEHSAPIRDRILHNLSFAGLLPDNSGPAQWQALPAEEEIEIARHCRTLLKAPPQA